MSSSSSDLPAPEGPGSVSGAPNLPAGFTGTFTSRYVDAGGLRQHVVTRRRGPAAAAGARLAPDLVRLAAADASAGPGLLRRRARPARYRLSGKPEGGYDPGTLARDMVALMDALGHQRFAVVGTDTGLPIGHALAADHPDRVERVALCEVPGPPGTVPQPPFFVPEPLNNRLWRIAVNRLDKVNEQLVQGREDIYFGYEFAIQAGTKLPDDVINYHVGLLTNPDSLHGSFAFYREWDTMMAQNAERAKRPLTMPVLGISGAASWGEQVGSAMKSLATDVQSAVIPGVGHWFAEEAPRRRWRR